MLAPTGLLPWLAVSGGLLATLYTHNTALLLLISCNLVVTTCYLRNTLPAGFLRKWAISMGVVVLGWGLWIPRMTDQAAGILSGYWIPSPSVGHVLASLSDLYLPADRPVLLYAGGAILTLALLGIGIPGARRVKTGWTLLLIPLTAPIVGLLVASLVQPVFLSRTLIWTAVPLYVAMGIGFYRFKKPLWQALLLASLVTTNGYGLAHYYTSFQKEAWDQAADFVADGSRPGDIILIHRNFVKEPFNYYFRRYGIQIPQHPLRGDVTQIRAQIAALPLPNRVWLVASHVPLQELLELLGLLQNFGAVFQEEKTLKGVNVLLFDIDPSKGRPDIR